MLHKTGHVVLERPTSLYYTFEATSFVILPLNQKPEVIDLRQTLGRPTLCTSEILLCSNVNDIETKRNEAWILANFLYRSETKWAYSRT